MITGNAKTQVDTPDHQGNHFFCAGSAPTGRTADDTFPIKAHMSDLDNGACPASRGASSRPSNAATRPPS